MKKRLSKSILADIDADEVTDKEDSAAITLLFTYTTIVSPNIVDFFTDCLSRCKFIDKFNKPELLPYHKQVRLSFISEHMTLENLCMLYHLTQIPDLEYNITTDGGLILDRAIVNPLNTFRLSGRDIFIFDEKQFFDFFRHYFPDASETEIIKEFIRAYSRYQDTETPRNRDKVYSIKFSTNKANIADRNGNIILNEWMNDVTMFSEGYAMIQRSDNKWNFVDKNGNILSPDKWFNSVLNFSDGLAIVTNNNGSQNFIKTNGKFLFRKWYKSVNNFSEGYCIAKNANGKYNFLDKTGKPLLKEWIPYECSSLKNGYAIVMNAGCQYNIIDRNGKLVLRNWFDYISDVNDGFAVVEFDSDQNFVDMNGRYISENWWADCYDFHEGYAVVKDDMGRWNFIGTDGKLLFPNMQFNQCSDFCEGFAIVQDNNRSYHYIDKKKNVISLSKKPFEAGFSKCEPFKDGIAKVFRKDGCFNFINKKGTLIFNNWLNEYTQVIVDDSMFIFKKTGSCTDLEGNLISII